jgi:hypothetical protein
MSGNPVMVALLRQRTHSFQHCTCDIRFFIISIAKRTHILVSPKIWVENPRTLFHGSISPLRLNQTSNQRASRNIESNARQMIIKHKHLPRLWQHFWSRPQDIANLRYGSGLRNKRSIITPYISCATTYWLPWSRKRYELTRTKQKENSRFWN